MFTKLTAAKNPLKFAQEVMLQKEQLKQPKKWDTLDTSHPSWNISYFPQSIRLNWSGTFGSARKEAKATHGELQGLCLSHLRYLQATTFSDLRKHTLDPLRRTRLLSIAMRFPQHLRNTLVSRLRSIITK